MPLPTTNQIDIVEAEAELVWEKLRLHQIEVAKLHSEGDRLMNTYNQLIAQRADLISELDPSQGN